MSLGINRNGWGELIRGPVGAVITGGILFGSAGTIDLWQGWLYTLLIAALGIGHTVYLAFTNPALLNARGKRSDMRLGDTVLLSVFGLAWAVGVPAVAGYELGRLGGGATGVVGRSGHGSVRGWHRTAHLVAVSEPVLRQDDADPRRSSGHLRRAVHLDAPPRLFEHPVDRPRQPPGHRIGTGLHSLGGRDGRDGHPHGPGGRNTPP